MYTNFDRLRTLEAVRASLRRYNGPLGLMADTPDGVDDDIYSALESVEKLIEGRIKEVLGTDLEREAV